MSLGRRRFLTTASALLLPRSLAGCAVAGDTADDVDFGPLESDPNGILDLPAGFRYAIVERTGDLMTDGHAVGGRPDGMACFSDDEGRYVLMRNHEVDEGRAAVPEVAFDPNRSGGVTRVVIDPESLARIASNWVLTGTSRNCAGGPSPWGWLSCEETIEAGHGYVFLCDPRAVEAQVPQRIPAYGRFKHEAVAIDPITLVAYLTEDENEGALYRHVPDALERPFDGRLQAMAIQGASGKDLATGLRVGDRFEVEWVEVADPEGVVNRTLDQARAAGAAIVRRGEGIWWSGDSLFFTATTGGPGERGQIFRLDPSDGGGVLTLVAQADAVGDFLNPDNLTVAPWGDLIVCEDNDGPCHLHRVTLDGHVRPFARNALDGGTSEFCGVCFSPDGRVLFVNLQEPGLTLAITGPFPTR